MHRGLLAFWLVTMLVTLVNVYLTVIFYGLMCFDTCLDVRAAIVTGGPQSLLVLLVPLAFLIPSLAPILAGWIKEMRALRHASAGLLVIFVACFPLLALVAGSAITLFTSASSQAGPTVYPVNIWYGDFALALWPLLAALVAIIWRAPAQSAASSGAASRPLGRRGWYTGG